MPNVLSLAPWIFKPLKNNYLGKGRADDETRLDPLLLLAMQLWTSISAEFVRFESLFIPYGMNSIRNYR
jgi:hypothetical protein